MSVLDYTYDLNGKQKSVSLNGQPVVTDAQYNIDTTPAFVKFANNVKTCFNYSTTNGGVAKPRLSEILVSKPSEACQESLYDQVLTYNLTGFITQMKEKYLGGGFIENNYIYDDLDRLIQANDSVFTYSPIGNILQAE